MVDTVVHTRQVIVKDRALMDCAAELSKYAGSHLLKALQVDRTLPERVEAAKKAKVNVDLLVSVLEALNT